MIIHKMYECEYCGEEFDDNEKELCMNHEEICDYKPDLKRCASCGNGVKQVHYECESIQCRLTKRLNDTCSNWKIKDKSKLPF